MGRESITDEQVAVFQRDGVITIDTPLTSAQVEEASKLMDRKFPLSADTRNLPGEVPQNYRVGQSDPLDETFVRVFEHPFFEELAKRVLHADSVSLVRIGLRNSHPEPTTEIFTNEHTDLTLPIEDLAATPRRMFVSMFVWFDDVDETCAPLRVRPGSHHQIAESMQDNPRYVLGPWNRDDYFDVPDEISLPMYGGTFLDSLPDLAYADPVPCVARAGQVTVLNPATIHTASTNIGRSNRKTMSIDMWPTTVEIGETKSRRRDREVYMKELRSILSPDRRHLVSA